MTRASPPRLASLGMLVWWAATSSAMPPRTPAGAPHEADGPDAHKLSLQPVGRGAHLDFERRRATCSDEGMDDAGKECCHEEVEDCSHKTYLEDGRNCHFYYRKWSALPPPTHMHALCHRLVRAARDGPTRHAAQCAMERCTPKRAATRIGRRRR